MQLFQHVTLTRRGEPVAVIISANEDQRLLHARPGFGELTRIWRRAAEAAGREIDPDAIWGDVRGRSSGREVDL